MVVRFELPPVYHPAESQPSEPQSSTSAANGVQPRYPPHVHRKVAFLKDVFAAIKKYNRRQKQWDLNLSPSALASLSADNLPRREGFEVLCTPLDLDASDPTAGPGDGIGFLFARPISSEQMDAWLDEKQPWLSTSYVDLSPIWPWHSRFGNAEGMGYAIISWLGRSRNEYNKDPSKVSHGVMRGCTRWKISPERYKFMMPSARSIARGYSFEARWIWRHHQDPPLSPGRPSEPHVVAFLCNDSPMQQDGLLAGEVLAIFQLTLYCIESGVKDCPVIPITIVSCSGHDTRVLHAYVDDRNRRVNVRKSSALNFDKGLQEDNMSVWKRLLCWVVAEPDMKSVTDAQEQLEHATVDEEEGRRLP